MSTVLINFKLVFIIPLNVTTCDKNTAIHLDSGAILCDSCTNERTESGQYFLQQSYAYIEDAA